MYVYEIQPLRSRRIFVIFLYNDRASDPPPPRDVISASRRLAPLQPQCVWGRRPRSRQLSALIPHSLFTASGQSSGSTLHSLFTASSQPRVRAAVRLTRVSKFLPARPRGGKGQGSASPGTRVQFRMDPPQSCPNVVSLQIGRGVTPRPSGALSPGAASTSSTGVSSRAFGLAVAYVSCHWRESRLGR